MNQLCNVKGVKFIHMNTRSLYRRIDEIRLLYSNFDYICCSETWLDDRYSNTLLQLDGMKLFRLDRLPRNNGHYRFNCGGGVCIFVNAKWISYCTEYPLGIKTYTDFEILTLKIDKPNFKTYFVSVVYKPPKGDSSKCMQFISEMVNRDPVYEYWVLGDFNVDFLKRNVPTTSTVLTSIRKLGFVQLIKNVTRPAVGKGTCIDWILTNSEYVSMSYVSNHLISDHYPVVCVRKKSRELKTKVPKLIRLYNRLDFKVLGALIGNLNWAEFEDENDVDKKWAFIKENVCRIIEVMCPLKKIYVRKAQPPWFDNSIVRRICDRERLSRLFRNTGSSDVLRELKIVRNSVTQAVCNARSSYINISLNRNKKDPRKFWRIINSFVANSEDTLYDGLFIDPTTGLTVPMENVAVFLNDYFANIGTRLNTFNGPMLDDLVDIYPEMSDNVFSLPVVDNHDILFLGNEIDVHKTSCIPGMRSDVCKYLFENIPDRIAQLFNASLTTGTYPSEWSMGFVNLIPKQGLLSDPTNWRPITQTNIFGKNLEKIVQRSLLKYFLDYGVITDRQYGFLPGKSTNEAIFDLTRHIYSSINNKKLMGLLFLDISKAFDCILHDRLLQKLELVGCDNRVITWFTSYLDRKQVVTYNDIVSTLSSVPTGIGQGTILGPLIFIFYMNDVIDKMFYVKLSMYADDCVLYRSGNNWDNIRVKLQEDLDCFEHWGELNNLHLNVKKTKMLIVGSDSKLRKVQNPHPLVVYDNDVPFVKQYNYLGFIIDSKMTLKPFFNHVKKTAYLKIFAFRKIRNYLTEYASVMLYKQMILPFIEYASFMLVACNLEDRRELQKCQNDALRLCVQAKIRDHVRIEDLHARCKIVSLEQRRRIQLLLLMYKKSKDINLHKIFPRNTRASQRMVFKTDQYEGTLYKRSPYFIGCNYWNNLPIHDIELPDILSFKKRLKRQNMSYLDLL